MQDVSLFIQHHPVLCFALLFVALIAAIVEYIRLRRQASGVTPTTAVVLMNRENAVIIDLRSKEAWQAGHITGALSVPLPDLQQNDKKIDKFRTHPVILACAAGNESRQAAALLQNKGLDVRVLTGGMQAWQNAGLPLTRS